MALKITPVEIDGEKRIHPETYDLLIRFAHHKEFCERCWKAVQSGMGNYCQIGAKIISELGDRPDVEFIPEQE